MVNSELEPCGGDWWAFTSAIAENEEESRADRNCEDKDDEVGKDAFQNGDEY